MDRAVEIDESKFTHHSKGGQDSKVWVLGFYERGTKDVRAFVMKDRTEVTCTQMIRDNVHDFILYLNQFIIQSINQVMNKC